MTRSRHAESPFEDEVVQRDLGLSAQLTVEEVGRLGHDHRGGDERACVGLQQIAVSGVMSICGIGRCDERASIDDQHSSALAETLSEELIDAVARALFAGTDAHEAKLAARRRCVIEDVAVE